MQMEVNGHGTQSINRERASLSFDVFIYLGLINPESKEVSPLQLDLHSQHGLVQPLQSLYIC